MPPRPRRSSGSYRGGAPSVIRRELSCFWTDFEIRLIQSSRPFASTPFFPRRDSTPSPSEPAADRLDKSAAEQRIEFVFQLAQVADRGGYFGPDLVPQLILHAVEIVADIAFASADLFGHLGVRGLLRGRVHLVLLEGLEL